MSHWQKKLKIDKRLAPGNGAADANESAMSGIVSESPKEITEEEELPTGATGGIFKEPAFIFLPSDHPSLVALRWG